MFDEVFNQNQHDCEGRGEELCQLLHFGGWEVPLLRSLISSPHPTILVQQRTNEQNLGSPQISQSWFQGVPHSAEPLTFPNQGCSSQAPAQQGAQRDLTPLHPLGEDSLSPSEWLMQASPPILPLKTLYQRPALKIYVYIYYHFFSF